MELIQWKQSNILWLVDLLGKWSHTGSSLLIFAIGRWGYKIHVFMTMHNLHFCHFGHFFPISFWAGTGSWEKEADWCWQNRSSCPDDDWDSSLMRLFFDDHSHKIQISSYPVPIRKAPPIYLFPRPPWHWFPNHAPFKFLTIQQNN